MVAVSHAKFKTEQHLGSWKSLNAEEVLHAYIAAIARDVEINSSAATLNEWRWHLLTTTVIFRIIASDEDIFWQSATMREEMAPRFEAVVRTAVQRVFEISRWVPKKEATQGR